MSESGKYNIHIGHATNAQVGDNSVANISQASDAEILRRFEELLNENKVNGQKIDETAKAAERFKDTLKKLPTEVYSFMKDLSVGVLVELLTRKI